MARFAALISYQGTRYCGWQIQSSAASGDSPSIQGEFTQALKQLSGEDCNVVASGRTDAGVHAVGQVAHFDLVAKSWESYKILRGLNSILPQDIRVLRVVQTRDDFGAQKDAIKKRYSYYFSQGEAPFSHLDRYSWWSPLKLDLEAMAQSLNTIVGVHDFKPFQASGSPVKETVREIYEAKVEWQPEFWPSTGVLAELSGDGAGQHRWGMVKMSVTGSGFLKQMVRALAGTLREVGEGRRSVDTFKEILQKQERTLIGQTAPARGLWLEQVWYKNFSW